LLYKIFILGFLKSSIKSHFYEPEDSHFIGNLSEKWKVSEKDNCLVFKFQENCNIPNENRDRIVSNIMNEPIFKNKNYTLEVFNLDKEKKYHYSNNKCSSFATIIFENIYEYKIIISREYIPISNSLTGDYGLSRAVPSRVTSIIYLESISYIQAAVDAAIISLNNNSSTSFDINVGHLSKPSINYMISEDYKIKLYSFLLNFIFIVYVPIITRFIAEGKEKKIKNIIDMYGFRFSDYLFSWNITYLIIVVIHSIIITSILYLTKFFEYVNPFLIFVIMILYGMSISKISFLISLYLKYKNTSGYISFCIITLMCGCYYNISCIKLIPKLIIISFCSPITFGIITEMLQHEKRNSMLWIYIILLFGNIINYHIMIKITSFIINIRKIKKSKLSVDEDQIFYYKQDIEKYINFNSSCYLEVSNISKIYKKKIIKEKKLMSIPFLKKSKKEPFLVLRHINFKTFENEILMILGPEGSGKSTLFKILIGLTPASSGKINYNGTVIDKDNKIDYQNIGKIDYENIKIQIKLIILFYHH